MTVQDLPMPALKPLPIAIALGAVLVVGAILYANWVPDAAAPQAPGAGPSAGATAPGGGSAGPGVGPRSDDPSSTVIVSDAMLGNLDASRLFELGFAGGLVIDRDTRSAIEAVLNSMPENPSDQDLQRLERTLRNGLPHEDAEKAIKLFTDYRSYTREVTTQMQPQGIPRNLEEANAFFDQMEQVRRRHFDDATANALFGPYDAYARATMTASFIAQDESLTLEQKKERLDAIRAQLPPDQQSLIPQPDGSVAPQLTSQPASQPAS
jgi:lipase chaperone LimK